MGIFFKKSSIYNVRMVITEEKILSNIEKVKRLINPDSKKQIIKLEDDAYFKDLVESITTYLVNYPDKKSFPFNVYKAAYGLVEFATNQFEENNKKIAELIELREENIKQSYLLQDALVTVTEKKQGWIDKVGDYEGKFSVDVAEALTVLANSQLKEKEEIKNAKTLIETKIKNLESNLFIEVDLDRIEDSSKALSFIGIEIAESLKSIPVPEDGDEKKKINNKEKGFFSLFKSKENKEEELKKQENINDIQNVEENINQNDLNKNSFEDNIDFNNNINKNSLESSNPNLNLNTFENVNKEYKLNGENTENLNLQTEENFQNITIGQGLNSNVNENSGINMFGFNIKANDDLGHIYNKTFNNDLDNLAFSNINENNFGLEPNYEIVNNENEVFKTFYNDKMYQNNGEMQNLNIQTTVQNSNPVSYQNFYNETRKEVKPNFFTKLIDGIKKSRFGRWLHYIFNIQVVLDCPEYPEFPQRIDTK